MTNIVNNTRIFKKIERAIFLLLALWSLPTVGKGQMIPLYGSTSGNELSLDLNRHSFVEENIMVPYVRQLERSVE